MRTPRALVAVAALVGGLSTLLPAPPAGAVVHPRAIVGVVGGFGVAQSPAGPPRTDPQSVSQDGRYVAFTTAAGGPGDTNGWTDVYVRDLTAGTTELISRTPSGTAGDVGGRVPSISADGRYVAFVSESTNLLGGAPETVIDGDVFLRDRWLGLTHRINRAPNGTRTPGTIITAQISADGTTFAWAGNQGVWSRRRLPVTGPIVRHLTGTPNPIDVGLRNDGAAVVFSDGWSQIWRSDTATGVGELVIWEDGYRSIGTRPSIALTPWGEAISFLYGSLLQYSLRRFDPADGADLWISGPSNVTALAMSSNGLDLTFTTVMTLSLHDTDGGIADVYRYNVATGATTLVTDGLQPSPGGVGRPAWTPEISADGRVVTVVSNAVTAGCLCFSDEPRRWAITLPA